jgi:hypothetical protein
MLGSEGRSMQARGQVVPGCIGDPWVGSWEFHTSLAPLGTWAFAKRPAGAMSSIDHHLFECSPEDVGYIGCSRAGAVDVQSVPSADAGRDFTSTAPVRGNLLSHLLEQCIVLATR